MSRDVLSPRCRYMAESIYEVEMTVDVTSQRMLSVAFAKKVYMVNFVS